MNYSRGEIKIGGPRGSLGLLNASTTTPPVFILALLIIVNYLNV